MRVDLIVPYTIKNKDGKITDFRCSTTTNLATGWFKMVDLPDISQLTEKDRLKSIKWRIVKSSVGVARLLNQQWLNHYPRANYITYDNGSEFKLHFESLWDSFGITSKPTTVKNPEVNAILERVHGVLGNTIDTCGPDMSPTIIDSMITDFIVGATWEMRST